MPRTKTIEQMAPIIQQMYESATGEKAINVVDYGTFMTVASSLRTLPMNQVYKGLMGVVSDVIISERSYTGAFQAEWYPANSFGDRTLKISFIDSAKPVDNEAVDIKDGDQIGVHKVLLPKPFESVIWGKNTMKVYQTFAKKPVKESLQGPDQMAKFWGGVTTNIKNQMEQQKEAIRRSTVLNLIGGAMIYDKLANYDGSSAPVPSLTKDDKAEYNGHVVHLFTEYQAKYGYKGTFPELLADPVKYDRFVKFVYARMNTTARHMANRGVRYHVNPITAPNGGNIKRFTPLEDLHLYVLEQYIEDISTQTLTEVRNLEYLKPIKAFETVLYWQGEQEPDKISIIPNIMFTNGESDKIAGPTGLAETNGVFAVMFDRMAAGVGVIEEYAGETAYDPDKRAANKVWAVDVAPWNDFTENFTVFLID